MSGDDFLLEIGTEELPPRSLRRLMSALVAGFESEFEKSQLSHGGVRGYATPRRLAVVARSLAASQPEQQIEKRGPSVDAAFDDDGNPTKAASGFANSCGVDDPAKLERLKTDKGEWLVYRDVQPGKSLTELIEPICTSVIRGLPIERAMHWGTSRVEFVRPVHWIVMLHGKNVLPVTLFGHGAGRASRGHRFMSTGEIKITDPASYQETLRNAHVIVDFDEREAIISQQLGVIGKQQKAKVVVDPALLEEVAALVEWPVALVGNFDKSFLDVPEEALISAMKSHQRYFHLVDTSGRLVPQFVTVANLESKSPEQVVTGNERVITPRLADAAFFYAQDGKTTLASKLERLKHVVFQSKLGSYHDKAERVAALAGHVAELIGEDPAFAKRAGLLSKADLVTDMVIEFPELQGLMGSYYAKNDGEPDEVALAIREHYLPIQSGGALPKSKAGQCVAIADKLDTLTGLFGIGQPPTGSRDPFALRRQTLGVIRICIECGLPVDIAALIEKAAGLHGDLDAGSLIDYLFDRMGGSYQERGIPFDTFNAVRLAYVPSSVLTEIDKQVRAVQAFRNNDRAASLVAANKRVANILKQGAADGVSVSAELFTDPVEAKLHDACVRLQQELPRIPAYEDRLLALANLQPVIDKYFDDVLVMDDDEAIRNNRIATLAEMRDLFLTVADVSVLQM